MGELIHAVCGLLAGLGLGVYIAIRWALRELRADDRFAESMFAAGAKAQAELGFAVKRVPIDGARGDETGNETKQSRPPAPKFSTDWRPDPNKGAEHPSGPVPPSPGDFNRIHAPDSFVERLKTSPKH
jgi:hypothetical protein